jgi:type II secretion system protein G
MLRRLRNRQRGFTLIELLIVVAIIGIIAALLIPNFLDALQKSKQKRTEADMKNLGTAMFSWLTDQAGAAAAGAAATGDVNLANFQSTTAANLSTVLVSQYIQAVPILDGWKHQYSFYMNFSNPLGGVGIMAILSYGRDGQPDTGSPDYTVTGFDPTDYDRDLCWADGYWVRYAQKTSGN